MIGIAKTDEETQAVKVIGGGSGSTFEKVGSRIYFYSEVDRKTILQMNKSLFEVSNDLLKCQIDKDLDMAPSVKLHINSYGGSIFAGLSGMDEILRCPVPVTTVVDGCAASAATFLSVVGSHRQISRNAYMLIHQLSSGCWGKYADILDHKQNMDELMKRIKQIYKEYTKVPTKKLDGVLNRDLWWDAKTCLRYGLVDEII